MPASDSGPVCAVMGFVVGDVGMAWGQAYCVLDVVAFTGVGESRRIDKESLVAGVAIGRD